MKKWPLVLLSVLMLEACNNSVKVEVNSDSLRRELDTSISQVKDSVKAKGERTLHTVKVKLDNLGSKKDSAGDGLK